MRYFQTMILLFFSMAISGLAQTQNDFKSQLVPVKQAGNVFSNPTVSGTPVSGLKKPALGALFSAAVPGAGEMYAGSWIKGAVFLGAEIALWVGYNHYSDKGQEWDAVFHVFADQHWSEPRYWVGVAVEAKILGVTENNYTEYLKQLREYERVNNSHSLHGEKDQQYYEMIGKYDQFRTGWDDVEGNPVVTPNRNTYLDMRDKSNRNFKRASTCAMAVLANHVLSMFDAAWTVQRVNRKVESKIRTEFKTIGDDVVPYFSIQLDW